MNICLQKKINSSSIKVELMALNAANLDPVGQQKYLVRKIIWQRTQINCQSFW